MFKIEWCTVHTLCISVAGSPFLRHVCLLCACFYQHINFVIYQKHETQAVIGTLVTTYPVLEEVGVEVLVEAVGVLHIRLVPFYLETNQYIVVYSVKAWVDRTQLLYVMMMSLECIQQNICWKTVLQDNSTASYLDIPFLYFT